jgi:hypothetical protein
VTPPPRGLAARILAAYPDFRASMARELAAGRDEPQMLAYVMGGCTVLLVAALPRIFVIPPAEVVAAGPDGAFGFFLANLVTFLFFAPLFLYGVAALARLVARAFGGAGGWAETRLATFWAILAATPVLLASSLINLAWTVSGVAMGAMALGYASGAIYAWIWSACLAEAHGFRRTIWVFGVQIALAAMLVGLFSILLGGASVAT